MNSLMALCMAICTVIAGIIVLTIVIFKEEDTHDDK